eukprot:CAMPEP_0115236262 /NCGR_PEP_ID=MMETSP0270-20121206/35757_1 /TAXON_ID=71861 /ORGANISM="Scrippsiella trochoidea, Strain CCMP3099" /LENGTH=230 /DNA_ID=CAMNT_0002651113 /DNA_START=42 /DNA_END=734 /DNA_ORIENTATION=+
MTATAAPAPKAIAAEGGHCTQNCGVLLEEARPIKDPCPGSGASDVSSSDVSVTGPSSLVEGFFRQRLHMQINSDLGASPSDCEDLAAHEADPVRTMTEEDEELVKAAFVKANLWSEGTCKHFLGTCCPCKDVISNTGCTSSCCPHCHFPHTDELTREGGTDKMRHCLKAAGYLAAAISKDKSDADRRRRIIGAAEKYAKEVRRLKCKATQEQSDADELEVNRSCRRIVSL